MPKKNMSLLFTGEPLIKAKSYVEPFVFPIIALLCTHPPTYVANKNIKGVFPTPVTL